MNEELGLVLIFGSFTLIILAICFHSKVEQILEVIAQGVWRIACVSGCVFLWYFWWRYANGASYELNEIAQIGNKTEIYQMAYLTQTGWWLHLFIAIWATWMSFQSFNCYSREKALKESLKAIGKCFDELNGKIDALAVQQSSSAGSILGKDDDSNKEAKA